jgi:hypothetical protein
MFRRMIGEQEWNSSAIGLLQSVNKAAVAILKVLMNNFELTFKLNAPARVTLQLGGGRLGVAVVACFGGMRENECAAEEHEAEENRTAEDPGGTDLDFHG